MESFDNISQEKYDKIKIFLISNFNLTFQKQQDPSIIESFEIEIKDGKILGNFRNDSRLELTAPENLDSDLQKISEKIKELTQESSKTNETQTVDTDLKAQEMMLKEYANNSKKFYEHILNCETCRIKLAEIWKHLYE